MVKRKKKSGFLLREYRRRYNMDKRILKDTPIPFIIAGLEKSAAEVDKNRLKLFLEYIGEAIKKDKEKGIEYPNNLSILEGARRGAPNEDDKTKWEGELWILNKNLKSSVRKKIYE